MRSAAPHCALSPASGLTGICESIPARLAQGQHSSPVSGPAGFALTDLAFADDGSPIAPDSHNAQGRRLYIVLRCSYVLYIVRYQSPGPRPH